MKPSSLVVVAAVASVLLTGCVSFVGENNPERAEVRFHNETDFNLIHWPVPTRLTVEEFVEERGVPQIGSIRPGGSRLHGWLPDGGNRLSDRPLCDEFVTHHFFRHVDPNFFYRATADEADKPRLDDLIIVEKLEGPCWDDDRAEFTVTGS